MKHHFFLGLTTLAFMAPPAVAAAQGPAISITPVVGAYRPTGDLGSIQNGEQVTRIRARASTMLGTAVEAGIPGSGLRVRGQVLYAPGTGLDARTFEAFESCGANCQRAVYADSPLADASVLLTSADLLVPAPRLGSVRPFGVLGAGVRRYGLDSGLGETLTSTVSEDRTSFVAHVGVGVHVPIRRLALTAEVGDYFGRTRFLDAGSPSVLASEDMQHDLSVTLGLRWSTH